MNKSFKTAIVLAMLSVAAVGCQKETTEMYDNNGMEISQTRIVTYSIDGVLHTEKIPDEASLNNFYSRIFALAREGHTIILYPSGNPVSTKNNRERVVYTTGNQDEAIKWAKEMKEAGYEVEIFYDETTGTYTCIAIR